MNVIGFNAFGLIIVVGDDGIELTIPDDMSNRHRQEIAEWEAQGNTIPAYVAPAPTVDSYTTAITALMDTAAQSRRYDNALSLSTYTTSTIQSWAAEAQTFVDWRDGVWAYAYAELTKVQAGTRTQPTVADFISELPTLVWPD